MKVESDINVPGKGFFVEDILSEREKETVFLHIQSNLYM